MSEEAEKITLPSKHQRLLTQWMQRLLAWKRPSFLTKITPIEAEYEARVVVQDLLSHLEPDSDMSEPKKGGSNGSNS